MIAYLTSANKRIPVIVCTAVLPSTMPELDPNIVSAVIRKPFDVERMAETVTALIE